MALVDTHLHLDDEQFDGKREDVIHEAQEAGVGTLITVGTTASSSQQSVDLAARFPIVHAAVGIQPNYCSEAAEGDWDHVCSLAESPHTVAIGETGLDCYWDYAPLQLQQDYFARHLELSRKTGLPFIVHMRDSGREIVQMLEEDRRHGQLRGVMHSFSGDAEILDACLELGMYVSFSGMLTFKKSAALRELAERVPSDRLLIETDAPWLSPHPCRSQRPNQPSLLTHTFSCLRELGSWSEDELTDRLLANSLTLFNRLSGT